MERPAKGASSPQPHPLSFFIRRRRDDIVALWEKNVRALPIARDLAKPTLIDHIPAVLDRIAFAAELGGAGDALAMPGDLADAHAVERLHEGFDLTQVVLEFSVLRDAITSLWQEESLPTIVLEDIRVLNHAIDRAVSASIKRYTEVRDRTTRALDQLAIVALESPDLDDLLRRLLGVMLDTAPAVDTAAIFLRDGDALRLRATVGLEDDMARGFTIKVGEGIAGTIAQERRPMLLRSAADDPRVKSDVLRKRGVRALYGVPLTNGAELIGVAKMGSLTANEFSKQDVTLFSTMASRATAAIYHHLLREEAERSTRELTAVIESMPAAVYVGDHSGVRRWNKAAMDLVSAEDASTLRARLPALATHVVARDASTGELIPPEKEPFQCALRGELVRRDLIVKNQETGADRFMHTLAAPVRTGDTVTGAVTGAVCVSVDFTDRRRLERALRDEGRRFQALADNIAQLAWMTDADGSVVWFNRRWLEYTGMTFDESKGWGWQRVHHPEHVARVTRKFKQALALGTDWEDTFPVRGKDGVYRWFLSRAVPIRDDDGNITRWFGTNTDVTEQRFLSEATKVLSSSLEVSLTFEKLAQLAVPALADWCSVDLLVGDEIKSVAVAHSDPDTIHFAREWRLRFPPDIHAATGVAQVIRSGQSELAAEITDAVLQSAARDAEHLAMLRQLGLKSYVVVPMVARGKTLGALTVISAESGRRYAQRDVDFLEELGARAGTAADNAILYAEAQAAIRLREEVLAVVSHDLKNPLSAIHMTAASMRHHPSPERVRDHAERIERSATRMDHLIADLLDMARLQTGHMKLDLHPCDARAMVSEMIDLQAPLAEERRIALSDGSALPEGTQLLCDRERLIQVFSNILGNSLKFGRAGDVVTIFATRDGAHVRFTVKDTGPGIEADELCHVFEPYWSAKQHRKRGTGLGLYICQGIIEAHGGEIRVESELGQGAAFSFTIPCVDAEKRVS